ncbi:hypothetical protein B566_EDAN009368 [Ephemera danica]|nr:hypothetical protein B566_EDAN009368 [Ephemera danica]
MKDTSFNRRHSTKYAYVFRRRMTKLAMTLSNFTSSFARHLPTRQQGHLRIHTTNQKKLWPGLGSGTVTEEHRTKQGAFVLWCCFPIVPKETNLAPPLHYETRYNQYRKIQDSEYNSSMHLVYI